MSIPSQWGRVAENEALEFFKEKTRSSLLCRNFRAKGGEIDLVFEEELGSAGPLELVFVEVRARALGSAIRGVDSVDFKKRTKIKRTIRAFLSSYQGRCQSMRFDVLDWDGRGWLHIRNQRLE
ncbi:MAG: YraN family protein [Bdellovibrionota bacterium]